MLYTQEIKHIEHFDVVVVGGGCAGFTAAVAAARNGARTALIEDQGALGGIMTTGGNPQIGIFYAYYQPVIAGIGWELCKRLESKGYATIPDFATVDTRKGGSASNVKVNRAMTEVEMNRMCQEAGVSLFFHTKVVGGQVTDGKIEYLVAAEKRGLVAFAAKVFIDCSGDGDVAAVCGAEQYFSEEMQPGTLGFSFLCHNLGELDETELRRAFEEKKQQGALKHGDYWPEFTNPIHGLFRHGGDNTNHIVFDGANAQSMTQAEIEGRESMARALEFIREMSDITIFAPSNYVAPRETRRTICDYTVTVEDFRNGRLFPDSLSYAYYSMDLHSAANTDGSRPFVLSDEDDKLPMNIVPTVPYSAMVVKGLRNLLTAGRCISAERPVMGALRVKATCFGMGQAVGTAAALTETSDVRGVDLEKVKAALREQGAIVPDAARFQPAK
jgi:2-polyprenyl-6-methoxyphenol hydroxylase-like FAD-dependent oxidoreductase